MTSKAPMDFKFKMQNAGQTKVLGSWPLAKGHVSSPLSFIQSLSQGVAQLSQIWLLSIVSYLTFLVFVVFVGKCLHKLHLVHLKNPFSSGGPCCTNLLGTVGFKISPIFSRLPLTIWIFCLSVCFRHFFEKFEDIYLFKGDIWQMNDVNKIC